jgi:hypothetical protein
MKTFVGALGLAVILASGLPLVAQEDKAEVKPDETRRHVEKAGGFSLIPPEEWQVREFPGLKFKILMGPPAAGFAPNINVVDEAFEGTLETYVKNTVAVLPKAFKKKFKLLKQEEFKTTAGLAGSRLVVENEQQDNLMRQTFYIFAGDKRMFVVTCTALADGGEKHDMTFEGSLKTFRFDKE